MLYIYINYIMHVNYSSLMERLDVGILGKLEVLKDF